MDNVIPIRPGIQIPNAFSVVRPAGGMFAPIRPAAQTAPPPTNPWKLAAIALGAVVVYGTASYYWHEKTAHYSRKPYKR